ncbi:MAG TPA: PilX N-terminal domain-containing pilus assembly protein [Luteimonas sp.]|nr:PilX N-terminal domain-containing pilus assembly protein [Luteimonas sp.]
MKNSSSLVPVRAQRGVSLIVVLVLLLIVTLLGLASLRGTLMEERMSANLFDRSIGFQTAEAALREGEALAQNEPLSNYPSSGCNSKGLCSQPDPAAKERWLDSSFTGWKKATATNVDTSAPEFFIETMGMAPSWPRCDSEMPQNPNCMKPRFRVTARTTPQAERASVLLQSTYAGP